MPVFHTEEALRVRSSNLFFRDPSADHTPKEIENVDLYKALIYEAYGDSQIAPTAWERFKPYLLIEGVEMNLKRILAIEKRVVGSRLFATIDMLLEAHELSLPPYDHRPNFELSKNTRLVDLLHYAYPEMAIVMPNLPGFFLHKARLNYHVELTWDDHQQLSAMAVGKDLDEEERLANGAHLLELIWYIVNLR